MQGDLISRRAAIDVIWDVFNQYCNDSDRFDEYETEAINRAFKRLQSTLEKQPAAYDVEKVVEQLELKAELFSLSEKDCCFAIRQNTAVDIVRKGGKE